MAYLTLNDKYASVMCTSNVLVTQIAKRNIHALTPTSVSEVFIDGVEKETETQASQEVILCVDLSRCCRWIALCSSNKELSIWNVDRWKLLSKRLLLRSAEKVKFTPSSKDVIVADKSGDAYTFSVEHPVAEGKLLLGHLSMLLDVLISDDEKYVITCDRDEKIRVSHFPNAYNIQSYCLGHKEFVSCIKFIPHDQSILISGSGDGYLRFWNYVSGTQIHAINCDNLVKGAIKMEGGKIMVDNTHPAVYDYRYGSGNNNCVVLHVTCFCTSNKSSFIGVCIQGFKGVLILQVSGSVECFEYSVTEMVPLQDEPWDICFSCDGALWNLSSNKEKSLRRIYFDNEGRTSSEGNNQPSAFSIFTEYRKWQGCINVPEQKTILFKRKFDNILDYAEKKKARLVKN